MKVLLKIFALALLALNSVDTAVADCQLVFTGLVGSGGGLVRGNIDGELPRVIVPDINQIRTAVSSLPNPRLYFTDGNGHRIRSVNLDGGDLQTLVTVDMFTQGIAVSTDFVFVSVRDDFSSPGAGKILRVRKDGTDLTTVLTGLDFVPSMAATADGKVFWLNVHFTTPVTLGSVYSANSDGSGATKILDLNVLSAMFGERMGSSLPRDIALDKLRNKLYIADNISEDGQANRVVWRSNLDGGSAERVGEFAGCFGSICATCPSCSPTGIDTIGIDATLNNLYLQTERVGGERLLKIDLSAPPPDLEGTLLVTPTAGFSPLLPLGTDQGLCNPSGTLSGTSLSDFTVYRPSEGKWYVLPNQGSFTSTDQRAVLQHGLPGDIPKLLNFDGDSESDLAVWRPREGNWYLCDWKLGAGCEATQVTQFGLRSDIPISADFDADGIDDLGVWRPREGNWYVRLSTTLTPIVQQWGLPGDIPLTADFDSDHSSDLVVFRPPSGTWYVRSLSAIGNNSSPLVKQWGLPGDIPLLGDYDGDGKPDLAIWRPSEGNWYICTSASSYNCASSGQVIQFGLPGDVPLVGDFDGDDKNEPAVWRPSTGNWYYRNIAGEAVERQWGLPGDIPVTH